MDALRQEIEDLRTADASGEPRLQGSATSSAPPTVAPSTTQHSEDALERRNAREALALVKPQPEDLPMWIEEAERATPDDAEWTVACIVNTVDGRMEGEAADVLLDLLREGSNIGPRKVIQGLRFARTLDPRVESRII